jgi:hypothetical protein
MATILAKPYPINHATGDKNYETTLNNLNPHYPGGGRPY